MSNSSQVVIVATLEVPPNALVAFPTCMVVIALIANTPHGNHALPTGLIAVLIILVQCMKSDVTPQLLCGTKDDSDSTMLRHAVKAEE
eukprot:13876946-Ditylum_brightwellii.AAC.1